MKTPYGTNFFGITVAYGDASQKLVPWFISRIAPRKLVTTRALLRLWDGPRLCTFLRTHFCVNQDISRFETEKYTLAYHNDVVLPGSDPDGARLPSVSASGEGAGSYRLLQARLVESRTCNIYDSNIIFTLVHDTVEASIVATAVLGGGYCAFLVALSCGNMALQAPPQVSRPRLVVQSIQEWRPPLKLTLQ